jgi:phospholipid/cholesterol/gamma-HCH transport system ATP-binding protein
MDEEWPQAEPGDKRAAVEAKQPVSAILHTRESLLPRTTPDVAIEIKNLGIGAGDGRTLLQDLNFCVRRGDIFVIMGPSGCGKSVLMRTLLGLHPPDCGEILYHGQNFTEMEAEDRRNILRELGVLFQSPALFSSMTLLENVALPLSEFTGLSPSEIRYIARLKLALVGLNGFEDYYPNEISGGMQKRAGLARAIALDPHVLLLDEPSAGLDPITSRLLDELILELRNGLGTTVVLVTHELPSIFFIGDDSILLDPGAQGVIAKGNPKELLNHSQDPRVQRFLRRTA